jgi:response regulator RpfG family c-di-GMP phosphodiesterase
MNNKNVLAIDDSMTNNVLLEAVLNNHQYSMYTALDAQEAYRILNEVRIDLILLDLIMPGVSGVEFLEEIKKHENTKNIPVIVVSAVTDENIQSKVLNGGAAYFLDKPVNLKTLINKVDELTSEAIPG